MRWTSGQTARSLAGRPSQRLLNQALRIDVRQRTELHHQGAKPLLLVGWEGNDAGEIVVIVRDLLLAKEAERVRELRSSLCNDVEEEARRLEKDVFVIDEELPEQAEVLAVELQSGRKTCEHRSQSGREQRGNIPLLLRRLPPRWRGHRARTLCAPVAASHGISSGCMAVGISSRLQLSIVIGREDGRRE